MTRYGPWVQPDDTEASPVNLWYFGGAQSEGTIADRTVPAQFAASVAAAIAGTGVTPPASSITAGLTTSAVGIMTQASHIDLSGNDSPALAQLAFMAPDLSVLNYPPVLPVDMPSTAVDFEYETAEGDPVADTLRIFGNTSVFAGSPGDTNQVGARLNRIFPGDYTLDGLGRPVSAWSTLRAGGSTILNLLPPVITGTRVEPFELASQSLDVNGLAVYTLVDLFLDSSWLYSETSTAAISSTASSGAMPYFTQTYTPPRYRFVYEQDPPLRQFPRADSLVGTGGVRQRSAGSRQASNRQGWNGTYLRAGWAAG